MNLTKRQSKRIRKLMQFMLVVLIWQFSFPQHAMAHNVNTERKENSGANFVVPKDSDLLPAVPPAVKIEKPIVDEPKHIVKQTLTVVMTAYSSTRAQTDNDPFTTASGEKVRDGIVAMNQVPFGTKIRIPDKFGDKIFVVKDRMSARYGKSRGDIWMKTYQQAKQWGVKRVKVEILK